MGTKVGLSGKGKETFQDGGNKEAMMLTLLRTTRGVGSLILGTYG